VQKCQKQATELISE